MAADLRCLTVAEQLVHAIEENRDALLSAAMKTWESTQTEAPIATAAAVEAPRERLSSRVESAHRSARGLRLTRALAAAADRPIVGPVVRRVSERRLSYLTKCFVAWTRCARGQACRACCQTRHSTTPALTPAWTASRPPLANARA